MTRERRGLIALLILAVVISLLFALFRWGLAPADGEVDFKRGRDHYAGRAFSAPDSFEAPPVYRAKSAVIFADEDTGCEYLVEYHNSWQPIPLLRADGKPGKGCREMP